MPDLKPYLRFVPDLEICDVKVDRFAWRFMPDLKPCLWFVPDLVE